MQYLSCRAEWNKSHVVIRVRSFGCKVSGMIENSRLLGTGDNEIRWVILQTQTSPFLQLKPLHPKA